MFKKLRNYMVRVDDVVVCLKCRRRFDIPSHQNLAFFQEPAPQNATQLVLRRRLLERWGLGPNTEPATGLAAPGDCAVERNGVSCAAQAPGPTRPLAVEARGSPGGRRAPECGL